MDAAQVLRLIEQKLAATGRDTSADTVNQVAQQLIATGDRDFIRSFLTDPNEQPPDWIPVAPDRAQPAPTEQPASTGVLSSLFDVVQEAALAPTRAAQGLASVADWLTGGAVGGDAAARGEEFIAGAEQAMREPQTQAGIQDIQQAEGALGVLGAVARNPIATAVLGAESVGPMLAGGAVGAPIRAVAAAPAIAKVAPWLARAAPSIGEGVIAGAMEEGDAGTKAMVAASTAILGRLGGAAAQRMGLADIDAVVAGQATPAQMQEIVSTGARVLGSAFVEGVMEEAPQEAAQQMISNLRSGRAWNEGVTEAATLGGVLGAGMGGAAAMVTPQRRAAQPDAAPPPQVEPTPAPTPEPVTDTATDTATDTEADTETVAPPDETNLTTGETNELVYGMSPVGIMQPRQTEIPIEDTPAAPTPLPEPEQQVEREAASVVDFKPDELLVDAQRFQFKSGGDTEGVTERLQGVKKWDPIQSGVVLVWQDRDGNNYVVDGHQRSGLARRLYEDDPSVRLTARMLREEDGITDADARIIAAAKNIAEGSADPVDAAKIIRETDRPLNLPPQSAIVRQARGLADLGEGAFQLVATGITEPIYGSLVGKLVPRNEDGGPDDVLQMGVLKALDRYNPQNQNQAAAIIRDSLAATGEKVETADLFGSIETQTPLIAERARVLDKALATLRSNKRLFRAVAERAGELEKEGNVLAREQNVERQRSDAEIQAVIEKLASSAGPVSDALTEAAQRFRDGQPIGQAAREFVEQAGASWRGPGRDGSAGEPAAPPQAEPAEPAGQPGEPGGLFADDAAEPAADEPAADADVAAVQEADAEGYSDAKFRSRLAELKDEPAPEGEVPKLKNPLPLHDTDESKFDTWKAIRKAREAEGAKEVEEEVDLDSLVTHQPTVTRENLQRIAPKLDFDRPLGSVLERNGELLVYDGNHRLAAAKLGGAKRVKVTRLVAPPKSKTPKEPTGPPASEIRPHLVREEDGGWIVSDDSPLAKDEVLGETFWDNEEEAIAAVRKVLAERPKSLWERAQPAGKQAVPDSLVQAWTPVTNQKKEEVGQLRQVGERFEARRGDVTREFDSAKKARAWIREAPARQAKPPKPKATDQQKSDRLSAMREAAARAKKPTPKKADPRKALQKRLDRIESKLDRLREREYEAELDDRDALATQIVDLEDQQAELYAELNALPRDDDTDVDDDLEESDIAAPSIPAPRGRASRVREQEGIGAVPNPPATPTIDGRMVNVEFPELVELSNAMVSSPVVRKLRGKATGMFRGPGGIELDASLFTKSKRRELLADTRPRDRPHGRLADRCRPNAEARQPARTPRRAPVVPEGRTPDGRGEVPQQRRPRGSVEPVARVAPVRPCGGERHLRLVPEEGRRTVRRCAVRAARQPRLGTAGSADVRQRVLRQPRQADEVPRRLQGDPASSRWPGPRGADP